MLAEFLETAFADADVLIAPVMPFLPPRSADVDIGASPEMNRIVSAMTSFTRPFSYLGLPVATLPVAVSPEGLPVAIQIIGRPWREAQIAPSPVSSNANFPSNPSCRKARRWRSRHKRTLKGCL